jgi:hypothetical protein
MSQGIILLLFIALIVAYVVTRTRRRMGLLVTGNTWLVVTTIVVVGVLALWASQTHYSHRVSKQYAAAYAALDRHLEPDRFAVVSGP